MWRDSLLRRYIFLGLVTGGLLAASSECLPLRDDAVTAADLAGRVPAFGRLPGPTQVAWAPSPGVTRWMPHGELARIGRQLGIAVELPEVGPYSELGGVCVTRLVEPLDREKILAAMQKAGQAAGPGFAIELVSFGPATAPPGRVEFSSRTLPHLPRPTANSGLKDVPVILWRGRLMGESGRAFSVWARARVSIRRPGLVTRRTLEAGQIVGDDAIERMELVDYPAWEAPLADLGLAIGRRVRRAIPAHTALLPRLLALRRDVERGDSVEIELPAGERAGEASATLTAQAESPGRAGEMILLKNPLTGLRFSSKVTGVGRAVMTPERGASRPRASAPKSPAEKSMEDSADARP